jgi:hypothetical protein
MVVGYKYASTWKNPIINGIKVAPSLFKLLSNYKEVS